MVPQDLQQTCHMRTCVYGEDAEESWSSYNWGLPTAWLSTLDIPGGTSTQPLKDTHITGAADRYMTGEAVI